MRTVGLATLANVVSPVSAAIAQPILARGLGVDGRGVYAAATVPLLLISTAFTLGLPEALTQHVARRVLGQRRMLQTLAILAVAGVSASIALLVFAGALSGDDSEVAPLLSFAAMSAAPVLVGLGLRGLAAGQGRWELIAISRSAGALTQLLGTLALFFAGSLTPFTATAVLCVSLLISGIGCLPAAFRVESPISPTDGVRLRSLLKYGLHLWVGTVAGILVMRLDQMLMTPLSNADELGLYAVAVSIAEVVLIANSGIRDVIFAVESDTPNPERVAYATRVSTWIVFVCGVGVAAVAPMAVPLLFGDDFARCLPSLYVLLAGVVLGNPGSVPGMAMSAWGRPDLRSTSLVVAVLLNVVSLFLLVPSLGSLGASVATLITSGAAGWLNIYWMRRKYGLRIGDLVVPKPEDVKRLRLELVGRLRRMHTRFTRT